MDGREVQVLPLFTLEPGYTNEIYDRCDVIHRRLRRCAAVRTESCRASWLYCFSSDTKHITHILAARFASNGR